MDIASHTPHFMRTRAAKLAALWTLFALASAGTYVLAHRIEVRSDASSNAAGAFLSSGRSHEVDLYESAPDPASVEASVGDEVLFVVKNGFHDIADERGNRREARLESGEIGKGESYSLVFAEPGTYYLYDRLNQDIRITVHIK